MTHIITFQDTQMDIIDHIGRRWLRGTQIGDALGFANPRQAIPKIYERNEEEFTPEMTTMVELPTDGGPQMTRIFSPRGTWLLAMFAKTKVAMEFRKWVLDVLEGKEGVLHQPITISASRYVELLEVENAHVKLTAGKRKFLSEAQKQDILRLRDLNLGPAAIGREIGRNAETVSSYLRRTSREIRHV